MLIANTSGTPGSAQVTLLFEDVTTAQQTFALAPNSRFNVAVGPMFPEAAGRRFGTIVESLAAEGHPAADIVVERAMYSDAMGVDWGAGTNARATKLR